MCRLVNARNDQSRAVILGIGPLMILLETSLELVLRIWIGNPSCCVLGVGLLDSGVMEPLGDACKFNSGGDGEHTNIRPPPDNLEGFLFPVFIPD